MNKIEYRKCPICRSDYISVVFEAKDHTVSGETFGIWQCQNCCSRFTQGVPTLPEIGRYYQSAAYISHSDTKKGIVNSLYHFVRNFTLSSKRNLIVRETKIKSGSILDVGAGTGAFAAKMKKAGWEVTGIEPDETARANARSNHDLALLDSHQLFYLNSNEFEAITLWHVLEHVHELHDYISRFQTLLKDEGKLFIAVPNFTSADAKKYREFWAAYDVPRHLYHFSPEGMQALLQEHGFYIHAYKPMWFDSFYVSMLSEKYKTGRPNPFRAFFAGLHSNLKAISNVKRCSSIIYVAAKYPV